jgi:hypothetical protein
VRPIAARRARSVTGSVTARDCVLAAGMTEAGSSGTSRPHLARRPACLAFAADPGAEPRVRPAGVRLLLDQNLSPHLVDALQDLYPGSTHVRDVGLASADDEAAWNFAAQPSSRRTPTSGSVP